MIKSERLVERVALVAGGGGEIGGAICRRLSQEGAQVAVADLKIEKAQETAAAIASSGGAAVPIHVDVADLESARGAVAATIQAFGKLTTLVNVAAAVTPDGTAETLALEDWETALRVNLTGAFLMCKFAAPEMRRAGGGAIINIASQLGHLHVAGRSPYCTSKSALIAFTKVLAMDFARDGIRANSISPGFILTERSSRRSGGKERARSIQGPKHLLNRPGDVDDIAAGAAYLASDDAAFVTGTDLLIDGGYVTFKGVIGADGRPTM
jgi:NAD(P)-dependent dehydrogenase (short-subunit alcohol dehydrogenase family)